MREKREKEVERFLPPIRCGDKPNFEVIKATASTYSGNTTSPYSDRTEELD
jgi:hypothetical protein